MKPMLAHKLRTPHQAFPFPARVQPKLNGVRMLFQSGICQSREEKFWHPGMLQHIREALAFLPPHIVLDGEIYVHGWALQTINGAASVKRVEPSAKTQELEYHVFDLIDIRPSGQFLPFSERHEMLMELLARLIVMRSKAVRLVETHEVADEDAIYRLYNDYRQRGYEGIMVRDPQAHYGFSQLCSNKENRWNCLLKLKPTEDAEFLCVGRTEGEGKYVGKMGTLICELKPGVTFEVGTGFSDPERERWFDNPPVGKKLTIAYDERSVAGVPLRGRFISVRDYE